MPNLAWQSIAFVLTNLFWRCIAPPTSGFFQPTSTLDYTTLPSIPPGTKTLAIGGWFKWQSCETQHFKSRDGADTGEPPNVSGRDFDSWHHVCLAPYSTQKMRKHNCNQWIPGAWLFDITGLPTSLPSAPTHFYMVPYASPESLSSSSKEITYTVSVHNLEIRKSDQLPNRPELQSI